MNQRRSPRRLAIQPPISLAESLELTHQGFETAYGAISSDVEYLTIVQSSNHYVTAKFVDLFAKQDAVGGRLIVVINGFDGLSSHEVSLLKLLEGHTHKYESQTWRFSEANTEHACKIIRGDINLIDGQEGVHELESGSGSGIVREEELDFLTALYVRMIRHICEDRIQLGV
ncbi:hypothetical protein N7509_001495 [Penicillium cosmopolitanum]|uniref:Uncharacterized protein n=1 Tax=Penicillium cosmopolitanum TaxID=1131564 RepID=A0A9W9W742_9EURO|nr:uncharacterized protein N7509_001495 [Penicillium cosmopolitanum]KAJ5407612.1 hypothetical protein N7509_001495 [Penicillium cosmopolitanum]